MLIPRRVRRRLSLPPGWVALGLLLLLGCQALQPWAGRVKQWNMMQLTVPKMKLTSEDLKAYGRAYELPYRTSTELNKTRPWHDVEFKGEPLSDFLNAAATESAIQKIIADTSHVGGVRIRFLPGSTYANLVRVLDIMTYTNQKKYWLDIHHEPTTFYAITTLPTPSYPIFRCGTGDYMYHVLPEKTRFWQRMADFWIVLVKQSGRAWVPTALLLVVISFLSAKQLSRFKFGSLNS